MTKVLVFTNLYPSTLQPGRAPYSVQTYKALSRHCDLRVLSPRPWWNRVRQPQDLLRVPRETHTGLEASFPSYWSVPGMLRLHARALYRSMVPHVRELRKSFPFDMILAAWANPDGVAAVRLAQDFDCPVGMSVLGSDINEQPNHPYLRDQIQWALRNCQRVFAVSQALGNSVIKLGAPPERVVVRHNAVDGQVFALRDRAEARQRFGLAPKAPLICYVGNLAPEKGGSVLIDAMGALAAGGDTLSQLVIIGDGVERKMLEQRAAQLGIGARVRFVGRAPHDTVPYWLNACDVFCLPSHREGCPNVVLEALASGKPVVATRVGGVPELLNPNTGILVPPGTPRAMAEALRQALERTWDPQQLRASVGALSWDVVAKTYHEEIDEVLEQWRASHHVAPARLVSSRIAQRPSCVDWSAVPERTP